MLPHWPTLPANQRACVTTILNKARITADDNAIVVAIDAALNHLHVRHRRKRNTTLPTHRLSHQLSLGGDHATQAIAEIAGAVRGAGTVLGAAKQLGVSVRTLHRWQAQHTALATAIKEALTA